MPELGDERNEKRTDMFIWLFLDESGGVLQRSFLL
jgi:hypothetical protein